MSALVQQTQEWLDMRKTKIGSSDAPVIMEISPWKTRYQLWEEKVGVGKEREKTIAMQRGLNMEEEARQKFEELTGHVVFPSVVYHPKHEFMIASLDGIDIEQRNAVEIKCPGNEDHQSALDGVVPAKYIPQLQHQLEVTGLDMIYYFSYNGNSYKIIEVGKDAQYIKRLVDEECAFWNCVQTLEAPKLSERDYIERSDEMWSHVANSWINCQQKLEKLKAEEEHLRESLICLSGKSNAIGAGVRLSKIVRKGTIDYKAVPELRGLDLELYRKGPVESWRISRM